MIDALFTYELTDLQTNRQTNRQTGGQILDRQTNHLTDKTSEIQMTRQTNQPTDISTGGPADKQAKIELQIDGEPDK